MKKIFVSLLAAMALWTSQTALGGEKGPWAPQAQPSSSAPQPQLFCGRWVAENAAAESALSGLAKQTRNRLIASPGDIAAIVKEAAAASPKERAEIELGIVRALVYCKACDHTGYQAIASFMKANAGNSVVADAQSALEASASASPPGGGPSSGGGAGPSQGGGGFGGGGGFSSSPGAPVSPN